MRTSSSSASEGPTRIVGLQKMHDDVVIFGRGVGRVRKWVRTDWSAGPSAESSACPPRRRYVQREAGTGLWIPSWSQECEQVPLQKCWRQEWPWIKNRQFLIKGDRQRGRAIRHRCLERRCEFHFQPFNRTVFLICVFYVCFCFVFYCGIMRLYASHAWMFLWQDGHFLKTLQPPSWCVPLISGSKRPMDTTTYLFTAVHWLHGVAKQSMHGLSGVASAEDPLNITVHVELTK